MSAKLWIPLRVVAAVTLLGLTASSLIGLSCAPVQSVERVAVAGNVAFAKIFYRYPSGLGTSANTFYAQSTDEDHYWEKASAVPDAAIVALAASQTLPKTLCSGLDAQICFRIAGQEKVEESEDGGQSWRVAWQVPANRQEYVDRVRNAWDITGCGREVSLRALDVAVRLGPQGGSVIVAMGGEGVVVRDAAGDWTRVAVLGTHPTPFEDLSPFAAMGLAPELGIGVAIAIAMMLGLLMWSRAWALERVPTSDPVRTGPTPPFGLDFWVSLILLLVLGSALVALYLAWDFGNCLISPMLLAITLPVSQIYVSVRRTLADTGMLNEPAHMALRTSLITGLFVFLAWWLCFYAWTSGLPVNINNALVISIALTTIIVCGGVYRIYSLSRSAHLHREDNTG